MSKTASTLAPVLQTYNTSFGFLMTFSRIYCLYPELFSRKMAIDTIPRTSEYDAVPFKLFCFGLRSSQSTAFWDDQPCGEACPAVWKFTVNPVPESNVGRGIGICRWGGWKGELDRPGYPESITLESDNVVYIPLMFKIDYCCKNRTCPNRGRGHIS